jgi:hypothetical protein
MRYLPRRCAGTCYAGLTILGAPQPENRENGPPAGPAPESPLKDRPAATIRQCADSFSGMPRYLSRPAPLPALSGLPA